MFCNFLFKSLENCNIMVSQLVKKSQGKIFLLFVVKSQRDPTFGFIICEQFFCPAFPTLLGNREPSVEYGKPLQAILVS